MTLSKEVELFIEAFRQPTAGCRETCHCGRDFYNPSDEWTWNPGELEGLAEAGATALDYPVSTFRLEGKEYVPECDCWYKRIGIIKDFVDGHANGIAAYLNAKKRHLQEVADEAPTVEEKWSTN